MWSTLRTDEEMLTQKSHGRSWDGFETGSCAATVVLKFFMRGKCSSRMPLAYLYRLIKIMEYVTFTWKIYPRPRFSAKPTYVRYRDTHSPIILTFSGKIANASSPLSYVYLHFYPAHSEMAELFLYDDIKLRNTFGRINWKNRFVIQRRDRGDDLEWNK